MPKPPPPATFAEKAKAGLTAAVPLVLYGVRLATACCLALYVSFYLELESPYWAGQTALTVFQFELGSLLRKAGFRVLGTLLGATVAVALTACFPQSRVGVLVGLALWGGMCGFVNPFIQNTSGYAVTLAGYTAGIIVSGSIDNPGSVLTIAFSRTTEITIGITATTLVASLTSFGRTRRAVAGKLAEIATAILSQLTASLKPDTRPGAEAVDARADLLKRTVALGPMWNPVIGEGRDLNRRRRTLRAGFYGLLAALSEWRALAAHLSLLSPDQARGAALAAAPALPALLMRVTPDGAKQVAAAPAPLRDQCEEAARALAAEPTGDPAFRLVLDRAAASLRGLVQALNAVALLATPERAEDAPRQGRRAVPDLLPSLVYAGRILLVYLVADLIWIFTAWPSGPLMISIAFIVTIHVPSLSDKIQTLATGAFIGLLGIAVIVAGLKFAVLPAIRQDYLGFATALSLFLVPLAAISQIPVLRKSGVALTLAVFFPLFQATNEANYDTSSYYNSTLAVVFGFVLAMVAMALLPPLSSSARAVRLVALSRRDLGSLARRPRSLMDWPLRIYGRLAVLPADIPARQGDRLLAALDAGNAVIELHEAAIQFGMQREWAPVAAAIGGDDIDGATAALTRFDQALASPADPADPAAIPAWDRGARMKARGSVLWLLETLRGSDDREG